MSKENKFGCLNFFFFLGPLKRINISYLVIGRQDTFCEVEKMFEREKKVFGNSEEIGQKVGGWGDSCQTLGVVRLTIMIMKISPKNVLYKREKKIRDRQSISKTKKIALALRKKNHFRSSRPKNVI